jgi:hypothetical protein
MNKIRVEERNDIAPLCPHCDEEIQTVWLRKLDSFFGKRYVYFCPLCRKVLGVTHRKGLLTQ